MALKEHEPVVDVFPMCMKQWRLLHRRNLHFVFLHVAKSFARDPGNALRPPLDIR